MRVCILSSGLFSRATGTERQDGPQAPTSGGLWADNATRPVHALIKEALTAPDCLIVTGYPMQRACR